MDIEKLAGRAALAAPVLHISTCTLYMYGYSVGFGSGIAGLFSISDFFTITLQHLVTIYALGLAIPTVTILARHRAGWAYISDSLPTGENGRTIISKSLKITRFILHVTLFIYVMTPVAYLISSIVVDSFVSYFLINSFMGIGLLPVWWKLSDTLRFYGLSAEIAFVLVIFASSVIAQGVDAGQGDRRFRYDRLSEDRLKCGEHVILAPIGERFLAATRDGSRQVIDDECKVHFSFEKRPPFREGSLYDLVWEKLDTTEMGKK